ncbi:hypothetical protein [Paenibacillus humicola]|uniref:hypothetical protein n=1 Tax=Paenibacillus humicola TaxID=3110540 RepID=UPI00237A7FEF|nr:hypothetical protein [Paenibacillus humicola]
MIKLEEVKPDHQDLARLIRKLDDYLLERYPADEVFGVDFNDPSTKEMVFILAYLEGQAVGCGGIRPLDRETAE